MPSPRREQQFRRKPLGESEMRPSRAAFLLLVNATRERFSTFTRRASNGAPLFFRGAFSEASL